MRRVPAPSTSREREHARQAAGKALQGAAEAEGWTLQTITREAAEQLPPMPCAPGAANALWRAVHVQLPQWASRRGWSRDPAIARDTEAETLRRLLPLQRLQRQARQAQRQQPAHAGPSPSRDGGR